jgi:hypothetical protein
MNTYEEQLSEEFLEIDEVERIRQDERWSIKDLATAVWADGVVAENEKKVAEIEEIYNKRLEEFKTKLDQWKENASKKYLNTIDFFKTHLHVYHMRVLDEERARGVPESKQTKTIKLPTRKLECRKQKPEALIDGVEVVKAKSNPKFVSYVKENSPEFIKTSEEVLWDKFKKTLKQVKVDGKLMYVDSTGQKIDFIELIERPEKYDWKPLKTDEVIDSEE